MASIFTFEPEPPRVASPWLQTEDASDSPPESRLDIGSQAQAESHNIVNRSSEPGRRRRLQAEPQDGPVEYKLHLLLRPRRKFRSTSTGSHVSGSRHSQLDSTESARYLSEALVDTDQRVRESTPPAALTHQTRQHRLEQLTTQLLWRLQQSSPHHSSYASNTILPSLPEALPELQAPRQPGRLLHGLEESHGALYEIGVSDDGTLIGLANDELEESLNNLRAMAACLGCVVEVLRKETVGDCEWVEDVTVGLKERRVRRTGPLFVVEALVKPHLQQSSPALAAKEISEDGGQKQRMDVHNELSIAATEQLRITLTGPTMSGKSTLLGTLTTSTLDNGRGKSRLSMLKHRHEITSGVTSSVTQELIGFKEADDGSLEVLNYATDTVVSWIDTHIAAGGDRLVFISDSAGHPRYRRTTIRGLVGWSPHWTLLCIPADDTEDTGGNSSNTQISQQSLGAAVPDMDLSGAQLDLCLRLHLPLVIVITKLDLASRSGLKASLTKVLDVVKRAGKHPVILKNPFAEITETELQYVDSTAIEAAYRVALPLLNDPLASVPIVLTSAVQGTGINTLQALLHELPIPENSNNTMNRSGFVFHIEDVYNKPAEVDGVIVSGLLRSGQISVGDTGALGPFSVHDMEDSEDSEDRPTRRPSAHLPTSRSFPGALRHQHSSLPHFQIPGQEWRRFRVNTIRNLRLPVHSLLADQVGTIAIVPDGDSRKAASGSEFGRIRKGMILTAVQPQAVRSFGAEFQRQDLENLAVGNRVVVYVCSVRAPAKVVSARALESLIALPDYSGIGIHKADSFQPQDLREDPGPTESDGQNEKVAGMVTATKLVVSFTFDATKEYVTVGEQVLVMPGGGPGLYGHERGEKGLAGLEGFVGRIVETCA